MRKLLITLIATALLSGCATQKNAFYDIRLDEKIMAPFREACSLKHSRLSDLHYWQPISETKRTRNGDCKATATYLQHLWKEKGIESEIVIGRGREGDKERHAWNRLWWNGRQYNFDATNGNLFEEGYAEKKMYIDEYVDIAQEYGFERGNRGKLREGLMMR